MFGEQRLLFDGFVIILFPLENAERCLRILRIPRGHIESEADNFFGDAYALSHLGVVFNADGRAFTDAVRLERVCGKDGGRRAEKDNGSQQYYRQQKEWNVSFHFFHLCDTVWATPRFCFRLLSCFSVTLF